jgi:hypothetical protein
VALSLMHLRSRLWHLFHMMSSMTWREVIKLYFLALLRTRGYVL